MNYEIHIKDRQNYNEPLILHYAARSSPQLSYLGGDDKTQPIIPSELKFTLENAGAIDGRYLEYFTSNETRYEVTKLISDSQQIIWRGFLLPESYAEPWEAGVLYPEFAAVDGLGLLKGKTLPDSFYKEEKTVVEFLAACLELTALDFDIYLAPAIQNSIKKNWHEIIMDGALQEGETAYNILEKLLISLRCQIYQAGGSWKVEGINQRHLINIKYWHYDYSGKYLGQITESRNVKKLTWLNCNLTMVPAIKKVVASHPAPVVDFNPETVQEKSITWLVPTGVNANYIARHWLYKDFYSPTINPPDNFLTLIANRVEEIRPEYRIQLRQRPWVKKGAKLRFTMAARIHGKQQGELTEAERTNTLVYKISINETQYFYNNITGGNDPHRLYFDEGLKAAVDLNFIAKETGFLNVEIWEPRGNLSMIVTPAAIQITAMALEEIGVEETTTAEVLVDPDSSRVVNLELPLAQDTTLSTPAFYLEKTRVLDLRARPAYMQYPILYARQQNGKNYAIVDIAAAVLIDQFPTRVFYNTSYNKVDSPVVHFNFNGGEEMAVETPAFYSSGTFYILVHPYEKETISRDAWEQWTDSSIGVEKKTFLQVAAEIEARLFSTPHLKIDGVADVPVKFNDITEFNYLGQKKYFFPVNVNWVADENETSITLVEGVYNGQSYGNIPPYVDAGPDIYLNPGETVAQILEAVVSDPDGEIIALKWEKLEGDAGHRFSSDAILLPEISSLTGDNYTMQLTATDNQGATAADTMQIIRKQNFDLNMVETHHLHGTVSRGSHKREWINALEFTPALPDNEQLILNFNASVEIQCPVSWLITIRLTIVKNGVNAFQLSHQFDLNGENYLESPGSISVTASDEITAEYDINITAANGSYPDGIYTKAKLTWLNGEFLNNPARQVVGVPTSYSLIEFSPH